MSPQVTCPDDVSRFLSFGNTTIFSGCSEAIPQQFVGCFNLAGEVDAVEELLNSAIAQSNSLRQSVLAPAVDTSVRRQTQRAIEHRRITL